MEIFFGIKSSLCHICLITSIGFYILQIKIEIYQCGEMADELMISFEGGVCDQVKEKDTPWRSVFEAMGIFECPITIVSKISKN